MFLLRICCITVLVVTIAAAEEVDNTPGSLMLQGEFEKAEKVLKELLRETPDDLRLLSEYETALNGLKKFKKADRVGKLIERLWKRGPGKKSPPSDANWVRVIKNSPGYHVCAHQYYVPDTKRVGGITTYYYFDVLDRTGPRRRTFYLEMSMVEKKKSHILREALSGGGTVLRTVRTVTVTRQADIP